MTEETKTENGFVDGYKSTKDLEEEIEKLRQQLTEEIEYGKGLLVRNQKLEAELGATRQDMAELAQRATQAESYEMVFRRQLHETTRVLAATQERARELAAAVSAEGYAHG